MESQRYVVMGAGEVGFHLARTLSSDGHEVTVVELARDRQERVQEELDVLVVPGNGAHVEVLEQAGVASCDLFMAVSSSDEANLAASALARSLGAIRTVVRVRDADELITHRRTYEDVFGADWLLSTELLTTTRILNQIRGHNTMAVEYLAGGMVQLRKIHLDDASPLTRRPLREVELPANSLVVAYFRGDELIIPSGDDRAQPGDDALLLGTSDVIREAERTVSSSREIIGTVVIAGGGDTGITVAKALEAFDVRVKIIERDRRRATELADHFPGFEVLHGDATDEALLRAERVPQAQYFVALSGHDESNLMSCLLAQELGVPEVIPLVHRAETSHLWRRLGLRQVFSPRALAHDRIRDYIASGYSSNIVSLVHGKAQVMERRIADVSPAAGATLAEMSAPRGLIVAAVARNGKVFVPRGSDRLEAADLVILFVHQKELDTVNLIFPAPPKKH
ncbi:MAG: Trk system potassium transporter TrkA [Acidobacteriota bacterium]|jgi:trk system potassium uptake protein TrkA